MPIHKKPIVIFAGAGISKEAPANLLSWREYNKLIIHEIGEAGARVAGTGSNLLDAEEILQKVPISTISDFLFNYSAGKAYFPLLKILEGVHPNRNHHLLAQLAETGEIAGIITTNFDTLVEQAFHEHGMPCFVYLREEDYADFDDKGFPIYKVHGSVMDTDTAIDTAQQKLRGLSEAKKQLLSKVFRENHIIFLGVSGEDFAFDRDYFPLADAKHGITWVLNPDPGKAHCGLQRVEHPGSCEDLSIHVRKNLDRMADFQLYVATIPEFCSFMGWKVEEVSPSMPNKEARPSAEQTVREFLNSIAVTEWGCAGMCMELFHIIKKHQEALELAIKTDQVLSGWLNSCPKQEEYVLLPLVEQTVSDLLTESIPPGMEQITETDRLMPLCDTMADTFAAAEMYSKAMKYYYFSLRITNQRFLEHIIENDYAKLRKSYNNMSTTKLRIGRMLTRMRRYDNASRFLAEAMEDACHAKAFFDIAAAFQCRMELDMALVHDRDFHPEPLLSYRLFDASRLYADIWCVIRLAKKAGNTRTLSQIYFDMITLFADHGMFSYIPLIIEKIQSYGAVTPEADWYLEATETLKSSLPDNMERAEALPPILQYQEPQYDTSWTDCRERDILSAAEGQEAYRLVCLGKDAEARKLLKETSDRYYSRQYNSSGNDPVSDREDLYLAEMFSYCYAKLEARSQNTFGTKEVEPYLLRCLTLEIHLWQTEYLTETTANIAQYYYAIHAFEEASFYAELCLCLCDDPVAHGIILVACAIAALSCINTDKKPDAIYYGNLYFQLEQQFPQASDPAIREYLREWLDNCEGN